ncbi:hypothetical protein [Cupriavidus basilensis]|uniref:hypothetical protein n=1 Tax=Cupriavidus basilensis TaxID=68895 RepID=UPI0039F66CFE
MGNKKSAAGCQRPEFDHPRQPTLAQAAQRLLDALDHLATGGEAPGFAGWENGRGEPAGDAVDAARHELRTLLARPPVPTRNLTGPDFEDDEAFERVWRSPGVQTAGQKAGWRGIAEAVWRAAHATAPEPEAAHHGAGGVEHL